jgi:hypothetical protein
VDFQWRKLTIADKVDATRTIPLSPYLAQLLATLPRVNDLCVCVQRQGQAALLTPAPAMREPCKAPESRA